VTNASDPRLERERLVREISAAAGLRDQRLLDPFRHVPRERFVPEKLAANAYADRALPIGLEQTISQPSMIALMFAALDPKPHERALEVGAGSGYAAALLSRLVAHVDAIEILPELAERARATLAALDIANVHVRQGHGELGLPERAPFDVILVSAGARSTPHALVEQLAVGGRIAIPVGSESSQRLLLGRRQADGSVEWERRTPCVFVPLVTHSP
jgi:protein-L-isoaspartate(D-aspartate) O-methyltransferase